MDKTSGLRVSPVERNPITSGRPPYAGVQIGSLEELLLILQKEGWSGNPFVDAPRADLREAIMSDLDLRRVDLSGADLRGADLTKSNLTGADLCLANLSGAFISEANLTGADLLQANLSHTSLFGTFLDSAHLRGANLGGANLAEGNLSAACLIGAKMDAETNLAGARIDDKTQVKEVVWNGVSLAQVEWPDTLGEEDRGQIQLLHRRDRIKAYREAAQSYRALAIALRQQGLLEPASKFRLREQRLEQRARFLQGPLHWPQCLFFQTLDLVAEYGERPLRTVIIYIVVLFLFAGIYYKVSQPTKYPLQWIEACVLSVSSFHGRGFFPTTLTLGDPLAITAAVEAVIGLFIELIFIAAFTRRFLNP
ncbi:hypothetical protein C5B42_02300 [Candidatus Cerribacteria bacterium 'Amazon FNV 2010 28 9']|uniref:Potassium channel domain-containing protein n=1 Tax=Candidatus Cerribacteria bacterium 'Amazon FNV 2010 28 9' TaxID=2081795 RepID=A0A317JQJ3_9BACT|nr:MAG: hypothetical protein C5B42_02300 [Candidatus Cerribacteria bacterium 'Amazon FNV 2010 28 9']